MDKYSTLKQYYGHSAFRAGQEELIDSILSGRDALCVMPTGGGKSLCYQIPALLLPGITLVVSPLISLMKDQVAALKSAGVPAAYINSSLTGEQIRTVYARTRKGAYKLIYVAPERLETNSFLSLMQEMDVSFLAVDEAHCISQWGQDFRPSYLGIVDFINALPRRPIVAAYTATATKQVQSDILRLLQLQSPYRIVTGFDRPNLYFEVIRPKNRDAALMDILRRKRGESGIVYCATRKAVEQVCGNLIRAGIDATRYHAGLSDEERKENQEKFQYDTCPVMVATNAFGMGIDKSNVRFVIHYQMPRSMEAYYQEAGRAGRDGETAECILLYNGSDIFTAKWMIEHTEPNENMTAAEQSAVRYQDMNRLNRMVAVKILKNDLAENADFRRRFMDESRAVAQLNVLCELALPLVKVGGQFLALKSVDTDDEIQRARSAIAQLGGKIGKIWDYTIPGTDVRHRMVIIRKERHPPAAYPRPFARIKKAPLG